MEKEIFSYCFSIKVKQIKWFYQVPQHFSQHRHIALHEEKALRGQQREIETFLVSNKRQLKVV